MKLKGLLAIGAATVVVAGGVATATLVDGSRGAQPAPETVVTGPAGVVPTAPVLPSPVMTLPGSTPTTAPAPKPTKPPEPVNAKFTVVKTATKSNQSSVKVGQRETFNWTLEVLCDPHCAVTDPGGDTEVKGRTWSYSYNAEFTCYRTNSAGKEHDKKKGSTTNKVVLKFSKPGKGKPQTFTGTIKERLKKECRGYEGEFARWAVDYKLRGTFAGTKK
jgi:hypothetical protein